MKNIEYVHVFMHSPQSIHNLKFISAFTLC